MVRLSNECGNVPSYIVRARVVPGSEMMVSIGGAWPLNGEDDGFVVRVQMLPTQWSGELMLVRPKSTA